MGRDPRAEPRAGDVLRIKCAMPNISYSTTIVVVEAEGGTVDFVDIDSDPNGDDPRRRCELRSWFVHAHRTATIIHVAEG